MIYIERERRFAEMASLAYLRMKSFHRCYNGCFEYGRRDLLRGFTIIELMIVVVILSIAALTAIPMMSSASSMQIRSATNLIMADLEYAKSMAITRGQNYSVVFNVGTDSYQIEDQSGNVIPHPVKTGFNYVMSFPNDSRLSRVDITGVNFNGTPTVEFDCLGSPDNGGTISLQASNMTATVMVEPVTGYITSQ